MAFLENKPGTWGVGKFKIPDFGVTELMRYYMGKTPSAEVTTTFNNPNIIREVIGSTAPVKLDLNKQPQPQPQPQPQFQPQPQPQPRSQLQPQDLLSQTRTKNVGDVINVGGRNYRIVDPHKGIIEPRWDNSWSDVMEQNRRESSIRGGIESAYNEVISALDEIAGLAPQRQAQEQQRLQDFLKTQEEALGTQKESSLQRLGLARQQVEQERGQAEQDIYSSLRNLLQASQQKLGLAGAGSSSAQNIMLPYAMGKQGGRALAQVQAQAIRQFNEIEMKKNDVATTYDLAKNQLNQDYQNKLNEIVERYNNYADQIRMQKANASQQKQLALAQLEQGLMEQARQEAFQLRNYIMERQNYIEDWARSRMAQLDDYKLQLSQSANFSPREMVWSEMQGLGAEMSPTLLSQGDLSSIISMMQGRKKSLEDLFK